ncbi:MAG: SoxR reducing system RseC family protein [Clostridiales bacterium]|nr:SoxR reducing system RseC family protein [Clostridiales bacterium]
MKRIGEIKEIHGQKMTVEFCNHESCENCHGCEGGQSSAVLELDASGRVGDFAEVEMPTGNVVKASLLVYIFPLLGFLGGMGIGEALLPQYSPLSSALLGALFLLFVVFWVHAGEKKRAANPVWHPTLVRIIPRNLHDRTEV